MSNETTELPLTEPLAQRLQALIQAAAAFASEAHPQYLAAHPESMHAFAALFKAGRANLIVETRLSPYQQVTLAFEIDGERHAFFESTRQAGHAASPLQ